ncbi:hypothetical protein I6E61_06180 [Psychrobacter sp. NZS113]|uniref:hypothetical protein n=1 Tax=Psychrobacter sp. NZS113 TaxID=2792045 RepID=UPI0018CEBEF7|nr:hypothetical protein [Psychrobacter sp. NZS113]MBH0095974.1 hypothetical protein [Psychrobacter sp. NZS113]
MTTKYAGIGFPKEVSLFYTTGILGLHDNMRHTKHLTLDNVAGKTETQVFACGYSFFDNGRSSNCGNSSYKPYLNKEATIGWYIQDKFLIFKNNVPQVVTVEVDDKVIISYTDTLRKINSKNKLYRFMILFAFPFSVFMYWLFSKVGKKPISS